MFIEIATLDAVSSGPRGKFAGCGYTFYRVYPGFTSSDIYTTLETWSTAYRRPVQEVTTTSIRFGSSSYNGLGVCTRIIDGDKAELLKQFTYEETNAFSKGNSNFVNIDLKKYRYIMCKNQRSADQSQYSQYWCYCLHEVNGSIQSDWGADSNSSIGKYCKVTDDGIEYSTYGGPGPVEIWGFK